MNCYFDTGLLLTDDLRTGVLQMVGVEWNPVWNRCRSLAEAHAAQTGCRTLDALHVASALVLGAHEFITSDHRQTALLAPGRHPDRRLGAAAGDGPLRSGRRRPVF